MQLKLPKILPNVSWTPSSTSAPAVLYSIARIEPKPPSALLRIGTATTINNDYTIALDTNTFTFKNTPTDPNHVQIVSGNNYATIKNLITAINTTQGATYRSRIVGSDSGYIRFIVEKKTGVGSSVSMALNNGTSIFEYKDFWNPNTSFASLPTTGITINGNDGALPYLGTAIGILINGSIAITITLSSLTNTDTYSAIISQISSNLTALNATCAVHEEIISASSSRLKIQTNSSGVSQTIKITSYTPNSLESSTETLDYISPLFEAGQFAIGTTAGHPSCDTSESDYIRLIHPAEPIFFRNENRPLIDLAENDKQIAREVIALRDGIDIVTGSELGTGDNRLTFKAKGGYVFNTDVRFNRNIFVEGDFTILNTTNLTVSDRIIRLNDNEAGNGVTGTTGGLGYHSGIVVDRGGWNQIELTWAEGNASEFGVTPANDPNACYTNPSGNQGGAWIINGPIVGSANNNTTLVVGRPTSTKTKGTVVEFEQVTIGDGINTFGTFNGTVFDVVLTNALGFLGMNGGKVYIKRGTYTMGANVTIGTPNVTLIGEGSATIVDCANSYTIIVNSSNVTIADLNLTNCPTGSGGISLSSSASGAIVNRVRFSGNLDIVVTSGLLCNITGNVSTTTSTNLP